MTEDAVLDRVRDVAVAYGLSEAAGIAGDFSRVPATAADGTFTLSYLGQQPTGGMSYTEEARGTVEVSWLRRLGDDYTACQRTVLQDGRALLSAVVADAHATSGQYAIEDTGRTLDIQAPRDAAYLIGRLRVSVNFETDL